MLPSLASLEEFEARIPGGLSAGDEARAQACLDDASALIRAEASKSWVNELSTPELEDVPDVVVMVCIAAARRSFVNPDGVRSEGVDNFTTTYSTSSPDVYLTKKEAGLVRGAAGKSGLWTQATTRGGNELDTVYVDVDPPGEPFPLLSREPF